MTIQHDTNTRWPTTNGTTGVNSSDTTTGDRTFSHDPTNAVQGVVVIVSASTNTQPCTGVLYGGIPMRLTTSALDTTEVGGVWIWTLTEVLIFPLDNTAKTVTVQGCTSSAKWATCSTVVANAATGTRVNASDADNTTVTANPTNTIATTVSTISYGACHTGANAPATAMGAGCTLQHSQDYGTLGGNSGRRTSEDASGSIVLSWTIASDDWCAASVALMEYNLPPPPVVVATPPTGWL